MISKAWKQFCRITDLLIAILTTLVVTFYTLVLVLICFAFVYCLEITIAVVAFHFIRKLW